MDFKYQEDMNSLSNFQCPPADYKPLEIDAYRWVFDDIKNPKNFTPQYKSQPRRFNDSNYKEEDKCSFMSLSMFINQDSAKKRFEFLFQQKGKKAYKLFGTKIAYKKLTTQDGVNEKPNNIGHFNHHPYINVDYENQFIIVGDLVSEPEPS